MKNNFLFKILICLIPIFSLSVMADVRSNAWPKRAKDGENGKNGYQGDDGQSGGHGQNGRNGQDGGHGGNGGNSDEGRGGNGGNGGNVDWPPEDGYSLFLKNFLLPSNHSSYFCSASTSSRG